MFWQCRPPAAPCVPATCPPACLVVQPVHRVFHCAGCGALDGCHKHQHRSAPTGKGGAAAARGRAGWVPSLRAAASRVLCCAALLVAPPSSSPFPPSTTHLCPHSACCLAAELIKSIVRNPLCQQLMRRVEELATSSRPRGLANTMWGLAGERLRHQAAVLLAAATAAAATAAAAAGECRPDWTRNASSQCLRIQQPLPAGRLRIHPCPWG